MISCYKHKAEVDDLRHEKGEKELQHILLFDLDGTLTDPGIGITNSVMYALKTFGIIEHDRTKLYPFIGPPLLNSFMEFYGFDEPKAEEAVTRYREYYRDKGIYENLVYNGIQELLKRLKAEGEIILLATSKPEPFAKQILTHFDLMQYFSIAAGSDFEQTRNTKSKVIAYALDMYAQTSGDNIPALKERAIMIGDRSYDIEGAKENSIFSVGALWGYGSKEELEKAGADGVIETPEELFRYL